LCPTRKVALCHWLVGITPLKNKGHTLFSKLWHDDSPSLLPRHAGQIDVVDMLAQSSLAMSGVLCGLDGEKAEVPSTPCTILGMGFKPPLQYSLRYK
jgi:hypothetical protein